MCSIKKRSRLCTVFKKNGLDFVQYFNFFIVSCTRKNITYCKYPVNKNSTFTQRNVT